MKTKRHTEDHQPIDDAARPLVVCRNPAAPLDPPVAPCSSKAEAATRNAAVPDHHAARDAQLRRPRSACDEVYRIYNAGRSVPRGQGLERATLLRAEAMRQGRRLVQREPTPEAFGLLALMLLHESRGSSSVDPVADLAMLERQNRLSWSRGHIIEARGLIDRALGSPHVGSYVLRAAIAAVHAEAATFAATDWARIVALHDFLVCADASAAVSSPEAVQTDTTVARTADPRGLSEQDFSVYPSRGGQAPTLPYPSVKLAVNNSRSLPLPDACANPTQFAAGQRTRFARDCGVVYGPAR